MEPRMIELTFYDFHEHYYDILEQQFPGVSYQLYVMKNGLGDVLYVGISRDDVWGRWFVGRGHMCWDGNIIYGDSPIGVKIENHLPESLQWKIQLWTLSDCLKFCASRLPDNGAGMSIREIEPFMIQKLRPALNVMYNTNPGKDTTPVSKKEAELVERANKAYSEIFNKK
jgi:hypothetical protein